MQVSPDVQPLYDAAAAKIKAVNDAPDADKAAAIVEAKAAVAAYFEAIQKPLGGHRRKTRGRKHGRKTRRRHS